MHDRRMGNWEERGTRYVDTLHPLSQVLNCARPVLAGYTSADEMEARTYAGCRCVYASAMKVLDRRLER